MLHACQRRSNSQRPTVVSLIPVHSVDMGCGPISTFQDCGSHIFTFTLSHLFTSTLPHFHTLILIPHRFCRLSYSLTFLSLRFLHAQLKNFFSTSDFSTCAAETSTFILIFLITIPWIPVACPLLAGPSTISPRSN